MAATVQELKNQLKTLPLTERAELAHFLIESFDQESETGAEAAWETEISRRIDEIKSGSATGVPADEVFARLRENY